MGAKENPPICSKSNFTCLQRRRCFEGGLGLSVGHWLVNSIPQPSNSGPRKTALAHSSLSIPLFSPAVLSQTAPSLFPFTSATVIVFGCVYFFPSPWFSLSPVSAAASFQRIIFPLDMAVILDHFLRNRGASKKSPFPLSPISFSKRVEGVSSLGPFPLPPPPPPPLAVPNF